MKNIHLTILAAVGISGALSLHYIKKQNASGKQPTIFGLTPNNTFLLAAGVTILPGIILVGNMLRNLK